MIRRQHSFNDLNIGTWFALPLPSGGWALGLLARRQPLSPLKPGTIFVYVFGPRANEPSDYGDPIHRRPPDRVLFGRTGDEPLRSGRWVRLGKLVPFSKDEWPMPPFRSGGTGGGPDWRRRVYLRPYNDDLQPFGAEEIKVVDALSNYPIDAGYGYIAMENAIERALNGLFDE